MWVALQPDWTGEARSHTGLPDPAARS